MPESPIESSQWPGLLSCPQVCRLSHLQRHRGLRPHPELLPSRDPRPQEGQGEEGGGKVQSFSTHRSSPCLSPSPGSGHDAAAEAPAVQGVLQVSLRSLLSLLRIACSRNKCLDHLAEINRIKAWRHRARLQLQQQTSTSYFRSFESPLNDKDESSSLGDMLAELREGTEEIQMT